jgi:hypothetical protein
MTDAYRNLAKGAKRVIWLGYFAYLIWMNLLGGWDMIIDSHFKAITNSDGIDFLIMLALYWAIVLPVLWAWDGF